MARVREIDGLLWAEWADPPNWAPGQPRGYTAQQKAGLAYEKRFGEFLSRTKFPADALLLGGPWLHFEDRNGRGWAQPDFLLVSPRGAYIFECKLKENTKAWVQLFRLYTPLLDFILQRPLKRVQVCKHLRPLPAGTERIPTIHRAKDLRDECIWNWTGRGA